MATVVQQIIEALRQREAEINGAVHADLTFKIQDGRAVLLDIHTKHRLSAG